MTTWTPRPRHPAEPACWSWPVPPLRSREDEVAHQVAQSMATGNPDDQLTADLVEALLDAGLDQRVAEFHDGRCAACGQPDPYLVRDHCHDTGQTRGYLCRSCNVREGIGGSVLLARYRCWHPAAILDVHEMYAGRGWSGGWRDGDMSRTPGARPPTPWPPFDPTLLRDG